MDDIIHIKMLGEFSLTYKGNVISDKDNRSKKVWTLLEYLVAFHDKEISQSTLIDLLWSDEKSDDPFNSLKTLLHRARVLLDGLNHPSQKLIVHRRDSYGWNTSIPYDLDTDMFEALCTKAAQPTLSDGERQPLYEQAMELYKGEFLPKNNSDTWAVSLASHYQSTYTKLVYDYCDLLARQGAYDRVVEICNQAVMFDPYDEHIHYLLIDALYRSGQQKKSIQRYQAVITMFYDKFGLSPSKELTNLYQEIIKTENATEVDLNIIQNDLKEKNAERSAYKCEYSVFQNLYRIEARAAARSGLSVFLCLITLQSTARKDAVSHQTKAMNRMSNTIASTLRSGDVFARYSINQFIIMLPSTSYENCTMIGERILKRFDEEKPKLSVSVSYTLKHMEPSTFVN
ncbi:MAG: diguanylate cyclase [Lachnospiraceae bacterium]|nr:diguanylate cyclase [Lachnospiraceae bacterium]MBP5183998.1 diguanylate cyclase [Lachnospiraceae bacterium]